MMRGKHVSDAFSRPYHPGRPTCDLHLMIWLDAPRVGPDTVSTARVSFSPSYIECLGELRTASALWF